MKIKILSLLFLFVSTLLFGTNWTKINSGTSEQLNEIIFLNSSLGFCIGDNGVLLKTTDKGDSFSIINLGSSDDLKDICYTGSSVFITTNKGDVFKSTNSGSSWNKINVSSNSLNCISFINSSIGIIGSDNGTIFRTSDGGDSWSNMGSMSVYAFNDVQFVNDTLVVLVGAGGTIVKSGDGGLNYSSLNSKTNASLFSVSNSTSDDIKICGTSGTVLNYSISGNEITEELITESDYLQKVICKKQIYYSVGYNSSFQVYQSGWQNFDLDSTIQITSLDFVNDTVGVVCGLNGLIYKTETRGGFTPIGLDEIAIKRLSLFPNPATNIIQIGNNKSQGQLTIVDLKGSMVFKNESFLASNLVDVSDLQVGLYFVRFISENSLFVGQFIKK